MHVLYGNTKTFYEHFFKKQKQTVIVNSFEKNAKT